MQTVLLGVLLLLSVVWLIVRIRANKAEIEAENRPRVVDAEGAFHAVSLKYSEKACNAAKAMTGRRFLSSAAPRLPLPDCDVLECRCTFSHHKDRRSGSDRRSPFTPAAYSGSTGAYERERREQRGRRESDAD